MGSNSVTIQLRVNGKPALLEVEAGQTLLSALRYKLDLTGAKYGCGEQQCGACVVLVDGCPTPACGEVASEMADKDIVTIEGLSRDGHLHPVQQAFLDCNSMQCGYCTPGMIMGTVGLLARTPRPTRAQVVRQMDRHICRCGAYDRILRAIDLASERAGESVEITA